jgi:hypothetical protein
MRIDDFVVAASSMATWAGDIEGKVTRVKGGSAVYLDAIAALATLFLAAATRSRQ